MVKLSRFPITRAFAPKAKAITMSVSMACLLAFTPANAGFLNDMYDEMSANANVTAPQIYDTQRAGVITGGGMVWKTPRRNFQPFGFTPPSLKAGCGGIDLFMGSFSMFSKDEFIQMLRAVGQNAAGLLFQMALQSLSPELAAWIDSFSKKVQEMNRHFGNSCEMAKSALGFTGLDKMAKEFGEDARSWGVANGIFPDRAAGVGETQADGQKVHDTVQPKLNKDGKIVWDKEMNLTWSVMKTGNFDGLSDMDKQVLQTMLGTVLVRWSATSGADKVLEPDTKAPLARENLRKWIGSAQDVASTTTMKVYTCDDVENCLNVTDLDTTFPGLAKKVHAALEELRLAVVQRRKPNPLPDGTSAIAIAGMTTIPVGTIINLATTSQFSSLGSIILVSYADAIAYDIVTRLMQEVVDEIEKAVRNYDFGVSKATVELGDYKKNLTDLQGQLVQMREEVTAKIQEQNASVQTMVEMENLIYGNVSKKILGNIRFGAAR